MSGEKVPLPPCPNKFVERSLFIDLLAHVNRHSPISEYLYVSFGGPYLEDFKAIHAAFGNHKMLSLEQLDWVYSRQRFNTPYGCVECTNKTSQQFIIDYTDILDNFGHPRVLIWLDYAAADQIREQLTEAETLITKLTKLDILKITLNANPSSIDGTNDGENEAAEARRIRRLQVLNERIADYIPNGTTAEQMQHAEYPSLLLHAVRKAASNAMAGANHLVFLPVAAYVYEDTHRDA